MMRPATVTMALSQNGMRQPHESSWLSGRLLIGSHSAVATTSPAWVPASVKLV